MSQSANLPTDPDARRYALILGLCLALHHGRFGGFALTPYEAHLARHHIDRLEREIAAGDVSQAA